MLTQLELSGARTLLGLLPEEDMMSLAQTITKGQIETPSKKGTNNLDLDLFSVRNRSGIIAQHGVSNAKPSIVDLILQLPETNF